MVSTKRGVLMVSHKGTFVRRHAQDLTGDGLAYGLRRRSGVGGAKESIIADPACLATASFQAGRAV